MLKSFGKEVQPFALPTGQAGFGERSLNVGGLKVVIKRR